MKTFIKSRLKAVQYALEGLQYILRTQRNTWIHAIATLCVFFLGLWLQLHPRDWAILVLTISVVWAAEAMNTAIESITDLISPQQNSLAKAAKDTSAAAVFATAAGSVIIGLIILGPPLWNRLLPLLTNK
jgi:diacylglycerol kinase (ATP)